MHGLNIAETGSAPAAATSRQLRDREATAIRNVASAMSVFAASDTPARRRALAENAQLWTGMMGALADPEHLLPASLRARMISVGLAVCREMQKREPDFGLLIAINQQISAGLHAS